MLGIDFSAFASEFQKIAEDKTGSRAAELIGLGTLAAPHLYNLATGKDVSHKTNRNTELAGLGILALPSLLKKGHVEKISKQYSNQEMMKAHASKDSFLASGQSGQAMPKATGQSALRNAQYGEFMQQPKVMAHPSAMARTGTQVGSLSSAAAKPAVSAIAKPIAGAGVKSVAAKTPGVLGRMGKALGLASKVV